MLLAGPSIVLMALGHGPKTTIYFKALILFVKTLKNLGSLPNDFYVLLNSHPASVCDL